MKKIFVFLAAIFVSSFLFFGAEAAEDITPVKNLPGYLTDTAVGTYVSLAGDLVMESDGEIGGVYVIFYDTAVRFSVVAEGKEYSFAPDFLQRYVDIEEIFGKKLKNFTLRFPTEGVLVSEVESFFGEELPYWVHYWDEPCEKADILLFSSHADDEQLFFSGLLPLYAGEKGLKVQVCYMTDHGSGPYRNPLRRHELLKGLWTVGVRNYPVISPFPDLYAEHTYEPILSSLSGYGYTRNDVLGYQVEMIRRFRPLVVLSHDLDGEYGHGMHILTAELLMEAYMAAADENKFPVSFQQYGAWDVPKVYLHLYPHNKITLDYDTPLDSFAGKTAFQVSQEGFLCHSSQQGTWFKGWMFGTTFPISKASQIATYSPTQWGLVRSLAGDDVNKNDFFENLLSWAEQDRIRAEKEAEAERLVREELEKERQKLEAKKTELEKKLEEAKKNEEKINGSISSAETTETVLIVAVGLIVVLCVALKVVRYLHRRGKKVR